MQKRFPAHRTTSSHGLGCWQTEMCIRDRYMHPGPKHIEFAMGLGTEEGEWTSLNTEAHLRSVFFGRSETIVVCDGELDLGEFGYIYFIDWDQVRARKRVVDIQITGE